MATFVLLSVLFAACNGSGSSSEKCGGEDMASFTDTVYSPRYASGFCIRRTEGGESTLITSRNPWQGADSVCTCLLVLRGNEQVPEGFTGQVVRGEARRLVAMSTTHVALLDAVGAADRIVGVSGLQYVSNATVRARRDSVADVGYEGNVDYERLMALSPDLVLLYAVSGASAMAGKLEELSIPYIYIGDYVEQSPLGKAEWLMVMAELTGRCDQGRLVFDDIENRYVAVKERLSRRPAATDSATDTTTVATIMPRVMLNTPYADSWFMPSITNYTVRLISDAGGHYVYDRNTGNTSLPIDMEEALLLTGSADVWINVGQAQTLAQVAQMCPRLTATRCFRRGQVYNNNARQTPAGGNDFFESGIVHPDLVLRDLMKIFHPDLVTEDFVYYRQLR